MLATFMLHGFLMGQNSQDTTKPEKHFKNISQLTNGGDNAEAYLVQMARKYAFNQTINLGGLVVTKSFIAALKPLRRM